MSSEYPFLPLGTVASVRSGYAFKSSDMGTEGHPLIKIGSIVPPRVDISSCDRISKEVIEKTLGADRYLLREGDILIAMTGATAGKTGRFPATNEECFLNQRVGKVYPTDKSSIDQEYLYQVLSRQGFADEILSLADGSAQGNVSGSLIETYKVPIPPLQIQKAIAHILGTLDEKIELNCKTNETLEAMAKALFKLWFVDFDPVRAKAEGRSTGLPAEISDLFPDSFEDSELGDIPREWSIVQLGDLIELAYGKPLKEEQRNGGIYSVFGSNGVVGSHDDYLVEAPGIVIGRKGNPGTVEWSERNFYPIDTTFFVVNKKTGLGMRFLFYSLKNQNLADLSADSAVPGLNRNHAYLNAQMLPPAKVACAFESYSEVIFKRREVLADEIIALSATRDALLPKLISGEIRIPDAEKMLENFLS